MLLKQSFYYQNTVDVAEQLLGKVLYRKNENGEIHCGRIVETEAYLGVEDPACHTFQGRKTQRTSAMYLAGGYSYVYLIYGMYYCLNVVTRTENEPEAVLIRALEPVDYSGEKIKKNQLHTNGPGKLCRYLGITKKENALPLWKKSSDLWIEEDKLSVEKNRINKVARIGVDYAGEASAWPLRFYLKESPWISRL